jgi:methylmalonyl-CoA mutase
MLDFADIVAVNKFDKRGALDALRDVRKQYQRNHQLFDKDPDEMPVYGTVASQFNDPGVNEFYSRLMEILSEKTGAEFKPGKFVEGETPEKIYIIPPQRVRYLSEISETVRGYNKWAEEQSKVAERLYNIGRAMEELKADGKEEETGALKKLYDEIVRKLDPNNLHLIKTWDEKKKRYRPMCSLLRSGTRSLK